MKFVAVLLLVASPAAWAQISVSYADNPANTPTMDFSFTLGGVLNANDTVAIYFDQNVYTNLVIPSQPLPGYNSSTGCSPDWCLFVLQPDLGIPGPGEFDLTAQNASVGFAFPFLLNADLLPQRSLAAPTFTVFNSDFIPVQDGTAQDASTLSAVPEPASLAYITAGMAAIFLLRRIRFTRCS